MSETVRELAVQLGDRSYPIMIGEGLLEARDLTHFVAGSQVMLVTNDTVAPLYLERARGCFPGKQVHSVILPDGERFKEWQTLNRIFDGLLEQQPLPVTSGACRLSRSPRRCCLRWIRRSVAKPASTTRSART